MVKVLIMEDEEALADVLANKLTKEGYEVSIALDGEDGLKKLREIHPDILLLDIIMPKVGGFEVLETMHGDSELNQIPVIFVSNSGQPVEIERAKSLGAKDYLIKADFDPEEVLDKMRKALSNISESVSDSDKAAEELGETIKESEGQESPKKPVAKGKESSSGTGSGTAGKIAILVVEDDQFLRDLIVRKLEEEGFDAIQAVDGEEGLRLSKEKKPAIILLDLILPGMDGFDVLKSIKSEKSISSIPVIILSNLGQKDDIDQGIKLGASDYLIKAHFTPGEIVARVKE